MSFNSKMTAIANEIRTLSGTTESMSLDAMASNVAEANTNVDTEANLIAQITSALEGKAAGDGSGGAAVETCTVTVTTDNVSKTYLFYTSIDENGNQIPESHDVLGLNGKALTVVCNTAFGVYFQSIAPLYTGSGFADCDPSHWDGCNNAVFMTPSVTGSAAFLNCIDDG